MTGTIKIKPLSIMAVLTITFSFMGSFRIFYGTVGTLQWKLFYYGKYFMAMVFIILSFSTVIKRGKDKWILNWIRKKMLLLFLLPLVLILIYSSILWLINESNMPYISRGISDFIFSCLAYMEGICLAYLFRKDALRYAMISAIMIYLISIFLGVLEHGKAVIGAAINFTSDSYAMYLELHEVAFLFGLYIVFLLLINKKQFVKKNRWYLLISILFFSIARKRIGILAVILVCIYGFLFHKSKTYVKSTLIKLTGIMGIIVCLLYVSLSISNELVNILQSYGINMMGRNIIYNYFRRFCTFQIDFMGHGLGFVSRQFDYTTAKELYYMASVKALHNNLLEMFIDIGFSGFILWTVFWFQLLPGKIERYIGTEAAFSCLLLILYAFITYTTDNTAGYFNFQAQLSMLITLICYQSLQYKRYLGESR